MVSRINTLSRNFFGKQTSENVTSQIIKIVSRDGPTTRIPAFHRYVDCRRGGCGRLFDRIGRVDGGRTDSIPAEM